MGGGTAEKLTVDMKRTLCLLLLVFASAAILKAQDKAFTIDRTEGCYTVNNIVPADGATLFLCTYTVPDGAADFPVLKAIGRRTSIVTEDESFSLVKSVHQPVWDEAESRYAYLTAPGQQLCFTLEFPEIPLDEPFDLIEEKDKENDFVIKNIVVDTSAVASVDVAAFLARTPYLEYGCIMEEGKPVMSYNDNDVSVRFIVGDVYEGVTTDYQSLSMEITNHSDAPLHFAPADLDVRFWRKAGNRFNPGKASILTAEDANRKWRELDERIIRSGMEENAGQIAGNAVMRSSGIGGISVFAELGLLGAGLLINEVSKDDISQEMVEPDKVREESMAYYLKDFDIAPGETAYTFFTVKRMPKYAFYTTGISLGGKTYNFKW